MDDLEMQYEHARRSGEFNMLNVAKVLAFAQKHGHGELVGLARSDARSYGEYLLQYEEPPEEAFEAWLATLQEEVRRPCPKCGHFPMNRTSMMKKPDKCDITYTCTVCGHTETHKDQELK